MNVNMNVNMQQQDCMNKIAGLFDKYAENPYMMQRLNYHILNILPSSLETEDKNHQERIKRNDFLTNEQKIFIQVFLSKNRYYYLPNNNCFYHYNDKHFYSVREDDIQHQLLSNISRDRTLMQWKYKTKINIIKQIKERNLFTCVPESYTIQNVLKNLYPSSLFKTKSQAKYFLNILGDNILKKNTDLVFLIKPQVKKLLVELDNIIYITTGFTNPTFNFMTKYHDSYSFDKCRIININDNVDVDIWKSILKNIGLDLLCLAVHYSNRCDSEEFINNEAHDEQLKDYTMFLKNNNQQIIFENFTNTCIQTIENEPVSSINWKNMHYIWKNYISMCSLPNVIYSNQLKLLLKEKYNYDESSDSFLNVISKYLPDVSDFLLFWEKTITVTQEQFENEFEVDELCFLFKKWVQKNNGETYFKNGNISERDVIKIINHYFPLIEIEDNKYILNISCNMWNKTGEINDFLQIYKNECKQMSLKKSTIDSLISFDDIYDSYCKKMRETNSKCVNKRFFEKYLFFNLTGFIEYDKFVSPLWFC